MRERLAHSHYETDLNRRKRGSLTESPRTQSSGLRNPEREPVEKNKVMTVHHINLGAGVLGQAGKDGYEVVSN